MIRLDEQCAILGLNRTSIYYTPKGESKENLEMMQKIDAEHLDHPAKGVVGMTDFLLEEGYKVKFSIGSRASTVEVLHHPAYPNRQRICMNP